jgi:hypothetical protein
MSLVESFNVLSLSVLNTFIVDMDYDITKHSSYETRRGNIGVPLAYGSNFGDFYLGSSVIYDADHAILPYNPIVGFGFGLGNSKTFIGFDSSISIGSVNPFGGEGFAHDAYYGFKLHRQSFENNSISIGAEDFISNGRDKNFYGSYYLNSTQLIPISSSLLIFTVGAGTGRFYTSNYYRFNNGEQPNEYITPLGFFGSVIFSLTPHFGMQISSSAGLIGTLIFFNPLFFTDVEGFMGSVGLMDISKEINKNNFNVTVSYTGKF